jgi:recombination protein RecT
VTVPVTPWRGNALTPFMVEVEHREQEMMALAPRGYDAAMFYASLKLYFTSNAALLNCSPASVARAMLRVAQTGLDLGVSCDILPFGKEAQFSARYNGLIELAHSAGCRSLNHGVVREGDDQWEWQLGSDGFVHHRPARGNQNPISYAWAAARFGVLGLQVEVMDREEIERHKEKYSKQWKATPLDEIPWYARKTVIRRICKYLPKNARFAAALRYVEEEEMDQADEVRATTHATVIPEGEATGPVAPF